MAFSLGRAAGAGFRRSATAVGGAGGAFRCIATPVVGLGGGLRPRATPLVGSAPRVFASTRFRPTLRVSNTPFQNVVDYFDGWKAEDLVWARGIIDSKLADKGLTILSTGKDAQLEAVVKGTYEVLRSLQRDVSAIKNKKGDITSLKIGNMGTLNMLSLLALLLRLEEVHPVLPAIQAWIKIIMG